MKDGQSDTGTLIERISSIERQIKSLDMRIAAIEWLVERNSKALTTVESTIGLDLMLAKIIIDR